MGNPKCWDVLHRVFDLAATHGGFDPSKLQAQFENSVDTDKFEELEDAKRDAPASDEEPEPEERSHI